MISMTMIEEITQKVNEIKDYRKNSNNWASVTFKRFQEIVHHFHGQDGICVSSIINSIKNEVEIYRNGDFKFSFRIIPPGRILVRIKETAIHDHYTEDVQISEAIKRLMIKVLLGDL